MIVKPALPSKPESSLAYWMAPLFVVLLSIISVSVLFFVNPHSWEDGITNFVCFLPMAFFFAAAVQLDNQKQIRALRQRIEQLEAHPLKILA